MEQARKRESPEETGKPAAAKRQKIQHDNFERPKSKKELRSEKKEAKKAGKEQGIISKEEYKQEKQRLRKEQRKEQLKEQLKAQRLEKKIRQQKRLNREINAPKKEKHLQSNKQNEKQQIKKTKPTKTEKSLPEEQDVAMKVLSEVIHGSKDDESGMTTLSLGVQYKDLVVGNGAVLKNKSLVNVKYKLTGGKFNAVLDSSNNFKFRVGKGEGKTLSMIENDQYPSRNAFEYPHNFSFRLSHTGLGYWVAWHARRGTKEAHCSTKGGIRFSGHWGWIRCYALF